MSTVILKTDPQDSHNPLILIFSIRERILDILTVGLLQCHFRILQASTSDIAHLKANQFTPDLVIADICENNMRDILMINRFQNSHRTKNITFLAIVPREIKTKLEQVLTVRSSDTDKEAQHFQLIEYPFNFSELLKKIESIFQMTRGPNKAEVQAPVPQQEQQHELPGGEHLFDTGIAVDTKLQEIASLLQKQWAFPFTIIKALDIIGSESSCCNELAQCIKSDPSASAAILKVSNTVFYAKRHSRITDIKEAIMRLGFKQTRNLLSCFVLIDLSPVIYEKSGFTRPEFWLHSISTALIAEKLCEDCGFRRPELAFVAGLIHDLGKIPLDNNFKMVFPKLLEETTASINQFYLVEKHLMNFTHAELGHYLTTQWNFPSSISLAVLNHHQASRILTASPVIDRLLFSAVFIANQISKAMGLGHSCDEIIEEIPHQMLRELKIHKGPTDRFVTSIIRNLYQMGKYLNIPMKNLTLSKPIPAGVVGEILFLHGTHAEFHPLVLALRHNGYTVRVAKEMPRENAENIRVIISMPQPGVPLDIMLFDDDTTRKSDNSSTLKIFILAVDPQKASIKGFTDSNIVFINQDHLDIRYVLHILDKFFGQVVVPVIENIETLDAAGNSEEPLPAP